MVRQELLVMKNPVVALLLVLTVGLSGCSDAVDNAGVRPAEEARGEEAIAEYDDAIRLDPQDSVAYNNRGNA